MNFKMYNILTWWREGGAKTAIRIRLWGLVRRTATRRSRATGQWHKMKTQLRRHWMAINRTMWQRGRRRAHQMRNIVVMFAYLLLLGSIKKKLFNQLGPQKKDKQKSYYGSEGPALAASSGCRRFRISVLAISWRVGAAWDATVATSVLCQIWLNAQTLFLLIRVVASCIF